MTSPELNPSVAARLVDLETTVAILQRRVAALEAAAGDAVPTGGEPGETADPWSVAPWPEIVEQLRRGKKINAIKVLHEHSGVDLKTAKDTVEEAERRLGLR